MANSLKSLKQETKILQIFSPSVFVSALRNIGSTKLFVAAREFARKSKANHVQSIWLEIITITIFNFNSKRLLEKIITNCAINDQRYVLLVSKQKT